jgi:hypothetical protein
MFNDFKENMLAMQEKMRHFKKEIEKHKKLNVIFRVLIYPRGRLFHFKKIYRQSKVQRNGQSI